ncbi:MAG: NADH-quinone oxidoreductase subunit C [Acidimicrobiales bacterium]
MTEISVAAAVAGESLAELTAPELAGVPAVSVRGQLVLHPSREQYLPACQKLHASSFVMCADLCGVDYLHHPGRDLPTGVEPHRFEVVVSLLSIERAKRICLRVQVPDTDPVLPSLVRLYPGADAMEREAFDMFGLGFEGHPDLTRILMPDDWEGHPLRKDYSPGRVPIQFKGAPGPR